MRFQEIANAIRSYHPSPDIDLVRRAYDFSELNHRGQVRASGESYFGHLVETALLVCELKLDILSVAAALLHDTLEDCDVTRSDLEREFGLDIANIVEGVTSLTRMECESVEEKQAESFRKMLLAMAKDIRVILVKLCDRMHNMRTLRHLSEERQRRKAIETQEIYAPLANRLGLYWVKSELEDYCLLYLRPEIYNQIKSSMNKTRREREEYIASSSAELKRILEQAGISASVVGRAKHFYSIWQKMERNNLLFEEVHDLLGFRVVVPTVRTCYEALGVVHAAYKPVPGRFKDYIAMPKPNMYQSLHTTVIGPEGQRIEVQMRTPEMHKVAQEGIAAHWRYKEGGGHGAFDLQWVTELVETQQYLKNPDEFIQSVKGELFPEEVFVFTPKGDLVRLPYDSTPVDFAYSVHTDIGHRTTGARVNGSIVPLSYRLQNGDTIEVLTSKNHVPSKDWLEFVKSSKAKQRIRAFHKSLEHARSLAIGMELLSKELRRVKQGLRRLEKDGKVLETAKSLGFKSEGDLYAEIGYGKISVTKVLAKMLPEGSRIEDQPSAKPSPLRRIFQRAASASRARVGVRVSGMEDILIRFAKCCEPLPGDRIIGFITRGRGVTIHNVDCAQILGADPQRSVDVHWDAGARTPRRVRLTVHSQNQRGLLLKVSKSVTDNGGDIKSAQIKTSELEKALIALEITVRDAKELERIKRAIEMLAGVTKVERVRVLQARVENGQSAAPHGERADEFGSKG
ncbi:MAG: bifunctional (p)ppGpp synthetase/guanosine-3',5'-bis(diphosphate) 3'-pyrophosphohydrolase [Deltaproteobacteria bacterium]|nr:bifunctional (p)ppGpp synthetase/guanosine-3',5'-bis(diphosphate) 3'-pyrophosphohydrolase [Deltaproteobacteria bacterium]